jgi:nucleoside-diphosphate-sugar epimerase
MWELKLGKRLPRPVIFEGDVNQSGLGLNPIQKSWVAEHCDRLMHNAANLSFYGSDRQGEPWRTNVQGTANILDFCREVGIDDFHYVSTAYVCGRRQGLIMEDDLDSGQGFRNDYEQSKMTSEKLVRSADFLDQITIYRPAVIAGDSRTGYTSTYHGIYVYLRLMSSLVWNTEPEPDGVRHTPVRLNMTGDEPRNVIPIDWASAVICHVFKTPAAHGRTFHLAPDEPITTRQVINAGYKYFNSRGVEFARANGKQQHPISKMDQAAHANKTMYEPYETSDPIFDTTNLKQFVAHLPCPKLDEAMIHRFWRYGEQDNWGKLPKPTQRRMNRIR